MSVGSPSRPSASPVVRRRATSRRFAAAALVVAVLLLHLAVGVDLAGRMAGLRAEAAMPARLEVAYVRQMTLAPPPPVAAAAPAVVPAPAPVRRARRASAASAPAEASLARADAPDASASSSPIPAEPSGAAASAVEATPAVADGASAAASAGAVAAASAAASAPGEGFAWPSSTRARYHLTGNYRGEVDGSAQVEWIRVGQRYQVHVDFLVGPSFAPVITQRSSSDGEITATGLAPRRYDQQVRVFGSQRPLQTVRFEGPDVVLTNGERLPAPPNLQDSASQFIQLTWLFGTRPELLAVGRSIDIPLALPRKVDVWTYDVTEEVELATPFGPLAGIHLVPRKPPGPGALRVEMWFAPELRYFPARLRIEQDATTYVDMMIEQPPEIAN